MRGAWTGGGAWRGATCDDGIYDVYAIYDDVISDGDGGIYRAHANGARANGGRGGRANGGDEPLCGGGGGLSDV